MGFQITVQTHGTLFRMHQVTQAGIRGAILECMSKRLVHMTHSVVSLSDVWTLAVWNLQIRSPQPSMCNSARPAAPATAHPKFQRPQRKFKLHLLPIKYAERDVKVILCPKGWLPRSVSSRNSRISVRPCRQGWDLDREKQIAILALGLTSRNLNDRWNWTGQLACRETVRTSLMM